MIENPISGQSALLNPAAVIGRPETKNEDHQKQVSQAESKESSGGLHGIISGDVPMERKNHGPSVPTAGQTATMP